MSLRPAAAQGDAGRRRRRHVGEVPNPSNTKPALAFRSPVAYMRAHSTGELQRLLLKVPLRWRGFSLFTIRRGSTGQGLLFHGSA